MSGRWHDGYADGARVRLRMVPPWVPDSVHGRYPEVPARATGREGDTLLLTTEMGETWRLRDAADADRCGLRREPGPDGA